jgi:LacI family transcriptional regulator
VRRRRRVGAHDYDLLLFANESHAYTHRALHHQVDGLVLMGADLGERELARLAEAGVPTVSVDGELTGPRTACVTSDNHAGGALAAGHLHALGHERIATIAGPRGHATSRDRLRGFREELRRLGAPVPREYVVAGDFYTESGAEAGRRLLALAQPPTAIFAASDLMAIGAIQAIRGSGLRVPRDVAVVGFDDAQVASLVDPPLTTVRQDKRGLGSAAGEAVVALVEDAEAPARIVLPVELVVRGST